MDSTDINNHLSKKSNKTQKVDKNYDGETVGNQFMVYFYETWVSSIENFISDDIIKPYSKLKFQSTIYEGMDFIEVLKSFVSDSLQFTDCTFEILDSGSRQIYILVTGIISNNMTSNNFSQTFMIAYSGEKSLRKWSLINSLLIIS